jgi:hypothetical protein
MGSTPMIKDIFHVIKHHSSPQAINFLPKREKGRQEIPVSHSLLPNSIESPIALQQAEIT